MLFSDAILKKPADAPVWQEGVRLFEQGMILGAQVKRLANGKLKAEGNVVGKREYKTSVTIKADGSAVDFYDCSCPTAWSGMCPHVVALGLKARTLQAGEAAPQSPALPLPEKKGGRRRKQGLGAEVKQSLDERLQQIFALEDAMPDAAARRAEPRAKRVARHGLDGVRLVLSYDASDDAVTARAEVAYGPVAIPLLAVQAQEQEVRKDGVAHVILRDLDAEREFYEELLKFMPVSSREDFHIFRVSGADIYAFLKDILPELEFRWELVREPSFELVSAIEEEDISSEWQTRQGSGIDWFDFSVEWHCANTKLTTDELNQLVRSGKPYVRNKKGQFVEIANVGEAQALLEFVEKAKKNSDGSQSLQLFNVPELLAMLQRSKANRIAAKDQALKTFLNEEKTGKPVEEVALPAELEKTLRPYQKDGVAWMRFLKKYHFGGILADDMGLGKTLQVLSLLASLPEKSPPSIVVCPKTLVLNWAHEAQKFVPWMKVVPVDGTTLEREARIQEAKDARLVVTSYSMLQRDLPSYLRAGLSFEYAILDEAHYVKNAGTVTAKAVKLLPASFRLAITGTPLENGVHELWSIFDYLMPGFLGPEKTFRTQYEKPIVEKTGEEQALRQLKARVQPFMLRRTKESHLKGLPPKIEQTSLCDLAPEQLIVYQRTLEEAREAVFKAVDEKGFQKARMEILAMLTKLRRICDHPALIDPRLARSEELSGKMEHAMELIREAVNGGHKVLLFSQFTSMLDMLRERLDAEEIGSCTIEGKTKDRAAEVKRFQEDPNTKVFLLSLKAGGTGLTLTAADTVILYDPWWNPATERQAMDRAHRMGQTKTVNVYKVVTKGTIEEKVVELQKRKQGIFDAIIEENADAIAAMTWEDVKQLFG